MAYTANNYVYSNRITTHAGYSWAADYQNGTSVQSRISNETRIAETRSLIEYQQELKAQRFGDNYEYREPGTCRNTNSIYPEYVRQQRMKSAEMNRTGTVGQLRPISFVINRNGMEGQQRVSASADNYGANRNGKTGHRGEFGFVIKRTGALEQSALRDDHAMTAGKPERSYYEQKTDDYSVESLNYRKISVLIAVIIAALISCVFFMFSGKNLFQKLTLNSSAAGISTEVPQEEISLTVGLAN